MPSLPSPSLRIVLNLDVGQEPIQGHVHRQHGPTQRFHGWLQLTSVIEAAREDAASASRDTWGRDHL